MAKRRTRGKLFHTFSRAFFGLGILVFCVASSPTPKWVQSDPAMISMEFVRAQKTELKALEHRQRFELKELKASQDARMKEWKKGEDEARHKFFDEHPKGQDRRIYIQDFMQRREALKKLFVEERIQRTHEQESKTSVLRQEQDLKLKDFKKSMEKGEKPVGDLWPKPGR